MLKKFFGNQANIALLITRIVVGAIFLVHGVMKFQGGVDGVAGFLGALSIPAPIFFAWVLALVETLGGIMLIVGLWTELASLLLGIVMVVAIVKVKATVGIVAGPGSALPVGSELDLALLAGVASTLLQGAGKYSLDALMRRKK